MVIGDVLDNRADFAESFDAPACRADGAKLRNENPAQLQPLPIENCGKRKVHPDRNHAVERPAVRSQCNGTRMDSRSLHSD